MVKLADALDSKSCGLILRDGSSPSTGTKEKRPFSNGLFFIQSEGLACNLTVGEYAIAEGVWHHAPACILLRIDYIQHFVLIPYRIQAADSIHDFAVIFELHFCTTSLTQPYEIVGLFFYTYLCVFFENVNFLHIFEKCVLEYEKSEVRY